MESDTKWVLGIISASLIFLAACIVAGIYSSMMTSACRISGMDAGYDSAHIAQICGK